MYRSDLLEKLPGPPFGVCLLGVAVFMYRRCLLVEVRQPVIERVHGIRP